MTAPILEYSDELGLGDANITYQSWHYNSTGFWEDFSEDFTVFQILI